MATCEAVLTGRRARVVQLERERNLGRIVSRPLPGFVVVSQTRTPDPPPPPPTGPE
jgi:hypothetical protein